MDQNSTIEKLKNIITHPVSIYRGDRSFDYNLSISLNGEVVEVKNLLFDLPEYARKLSLGADGEVTIKRIKVLGDYLKYTIPMEVFPVKASREELFLQVSFQQGILPNLLVHEQDIADIKEKIRTERERLGLPLDGLYIKAAESRWMKQYCDLVNIHERKPLRKKDLHALGQMRLFLRTDKDINYFYIAKGLEAFLPIGEELLRLFWDLIPVLRLDVSEKYRKNIVNTDRRGLLRQFQLYHSQENREWLWERFHENENRENQSSILAQLAAYQDQEIYNLHLEYFQRLGYSKKDKGWSVLKGLLKFGDFYDEKVYEIARECIALKAEGELAYLAYCILKKGGMKDKEIVEELLPLYRDTAKSHAVFSCIAVFTFLIGDTSLLPSAEELLDLALSHLEKNKTQVSTTYYIKGYFHLLLERQYQPVISERLYQLSFHSNPEVRASALAWSIRMLENGKCHFVPHPQLKDRALELLNDKKQRVVVEAIKWLIHFSLQKKDASCIPTLLPLTQQKPEDLSVCCIQKYALLGINTLLKKVAFDPAIHPLYLQLSKRDFGYCYHGRAAVMHALQLSPSLDIQQQIAGVDFPKQQRFPMIYRYGVDDSTERIIEGLKEYYRELFE